MQVLEERVEQEALLVTTDLFRDVSTRTKYSRLVAGLLSTEREVFFSQFLPRPRFLMLALKYNIYVIYKYEEMSGSFWQLQWTLSSLFWFRKLLSTDSKNNTHK